MYNSKVKRGKC